MSLRLRRGLEVDRTSVTPEEGELLYATDTKSLYAGDGTTAGGNLISAAFAPAPSSYIHTQSVASTTWTISHGLGFYPNVTIVDSGGNKVEGDENYIDINTVELSFSSAFAGDAYLS